MGSTTQGSRIAVPFIVRKACGISLVGVSSCLAESETDSRLILVAVALSLPNEDGIVDKMAKMAKMALIQ